MVTDRKLRELERKWKESGTTDDEAAYLAERVRVGDLSPKRLKLAAHCGHVGARKALEPHAPLAWSLESVPAFVLNLKSFGSSAWLHAAWVASRDYTRRLELELERGEATRTRDYRLKAELRIAKAATEVIGKYLRDGSAGNQQALQEWGQPDPFKNVGFAVHYARRATFNASQETVCTDICKELIRWALGYSDLVKDRVEARQCGDAGE